MNVVILGTSLFRKPNVGFLVVLNWNIVGTGKRRKDSKKSVRESIEAKGTTASSQEVEESRMIVKSNY